MHVAWQLWRERGADALWERTLGFLDWNAERTVEVQRRALGVQLRQDAPRLFPLSGGSIESDRQLREYVPLTSYDDYADTLGERRDDLLVEPPARWLKTSGRPGGGTKWIPLSRAAHPELAWATLGLFLAARARGPRDIRLGQEVSLLNMTAPPPYFSGTAVAAFEEFDLWQTRLYPANDPTLDQLPFEERMAVGFAGAARRGVDFAVSYSSVLAGVGGSMARQRWSTGGRSDLHQRTRRWRGHLNAWLRRRSLLPRDIWAPKAVVAGGMDAGLFRSQIVEDWGCDPLELFGSTDGLFMGMQTWDRTTITLIPQFNFFEFIPQGERDREEAQSGYSPTTVLLDELSLDDTYELVITNLFGGALVRYRTGELLRLAATTNAEAGLELPQFHYEGQRTDLIEVAGFARLSEQTFLRTLALAEVPAVHWTVRKEVEGERPLVHLRLELASSAPEPEAPELTTRIDDALRRLDVDWRDMEDFAEIRPLRLTLLPQGTFARAQAARDGLGIRIPRINPSGAAISALEDAARPVLVQQMRT